MSTSIRGLVRLLALACLAASLLGCNTMSGIGKDTAAVGEKIEKEADRHIDDDPSQRKPTSH